MTIKHILTLSAAALLGAAVVVAILSSDFYNKSDNVEVMPDGRLQYKWYPVQLPESMSFAGEKVPLDRWDVRERLDRELQVNYYMHSSTIYILKLTTRFFPVIENILKKNGIPEDFKYLCVAESALQNPTSPAGAVGYWQFIKETGTRYGLEISDEVDERYHIEKSTEAACRYLQEAYIKFGNWTAAAASYNCGIAGFNSHSSFQMSDKYYDLLLPEETNRYIFRILALKYLLSNEQSFGYIIPRKEKYQPVKTQKIIIKQSIDNLALFARDQGTSYKILKILNPWLRARKLTVLPGKEYVLELPE